MRYLKIFLTLMKYNFMSDIEYRFNIFLSFIAEFAWYLSQLALFYSIFNFFPEVNGWTKETVQVFIAFLFLSDTIWMLFLNENISGLSQLVKNGELDLILTKPISAQFMVSFRKMSVTYIINVIVTFSFLIYSFVQIENANPYRLLLLFILLPLSLIITYSLRFFFAASCLFLTHAESYNYLWFAFFKIATRPHDLYHKALRYFSMFVFPMAFMFTIPAKIILGTEPIWMLFIMMGVAGILLGLSRWYWNAGLKHYSSASS